MINFDRIDYDWLRLIMIGIAIYATDSLHGCLPQAKSRNTEGSNRPRSTEKSKFKMVDSE